MSGAEDEIRKLESDLIAAILRRDSAFLNDILADDVSAITPFGDLVEKALMTKFDDKLVNESIVTDEIKVRICGADTGIVTGRATLQSRYADMDLSGQYRFTRVYFKRAENWKIVAYQATRIAQQEEV